MFHKKGLNQVLQNLDRNIVKEKFRSIKMLFHTNNCYWYSLIIKDKQI